MINHLGCCMKIRAYYIHLNSGDYKIHEFDFLKKTTKHKQKFPSLHCLLVGRLKQTFHEDKGGNCSKEFHTTELLGDPSSGQDFSVKSLFR